MNRVCTKRFSLDVNVKAILHDNVQSFKHLLAADLCELPFDWLPTALVCQKPVGGLVLLGKQQTLVRLQPPVHFSLHPPHCP